MSKNTFFNEFVDPYATGSFVIRAEHYMRYVFAYEYLNEQVPPGSTVYDIGCGNGYGARVLSKSGWKHIDTYVGFDASSALLSQAPKYESASFFRHNFETDSLVDMVSEKKLPPPTAILAFEILEHLENPEHLLQELYSLLPENGHLMLSVPNEKYEPKKKGKPRNKFHKQLFSEERIIALLKEVGFHAPVLYGQPKANALYHRSKLLVSFLDALINLFPPLLPVLSRLVASPSLNTAESSYSIIIHAQK